MQVAVAILLDVWEALVNHLADILKAASANVLGLLALIVVAFAVIAAIVLSHIGKSAKLAVFFGSVALVMFLAVLLRTASSWPEPPPGNSASKAQLIIAGRIVDADNQGVPGLIVLLEGATSPAPRDQTDGDGNFRFSSRPVADIGALRLSLASTSYEPNSWRLSPDDPIGNLRIPVKKIGARREPGGTRRLDSSASTTVMRVAGKVIDSITKAPIRGATVELRGFVSPAPEKQTDSSGNFVFDIPGAGGKRATAHIFVSGPSYQTYDRVLSPAEDWRDLDIRLSAGQAVGNK